MSEFNISSKKVSELVEKYEVKTNERKLKNFLKTFAFYALVLMSVYHFYASGFGTCLLYTSPSPRDLSTSRMPSSA